MSIYCWIRDFLGYGEAEVAARKARLEAEKLEDERLEHALYMRAVVYDATTNDSGIIRWINKVRYHPKMREAYIRALITSILLVLIKLAHLIEVFSPKR